MVLIDSNVWIAAERGDLDLVQVLSAQASPAISAITLSELLHGVHRANTSARRAVRERFVEHLANAVPILPVDREVARIHARIGATLQTQGVVVGAHDLLIGCTALAHDIPIVTRDLRSFPRIPGLVIKAC